MRSLWLDRGTGPDPAKIAKYAITCVYEDIRDATKASVAANAKLCDKLFPGLGASGVYACWNWPGVPSGGAARADWLSEQLKRCDLLHPDQPRVHWNQEDDDPDALSAFAARWRAHRPDRVTGFTPQAHKATVYAKVAKMLAAKRFTILPQCYHGPDNAMRRVESASEVQAWQMIGCPLVEPMLWAEFLGDWWTGTAYIAGRLK